MNRKLWLITAVPVAAVIIGCGVNSQPDPGPTVTTTVSPAPTKPTTGPATVPPTTRPTTPPHTSPPATVGAEQQNATKSAMSYLTDQHFSRKGLIEQLKYEGYPAKASTAAVDSLKIDWNEQAALVARDYLQSQPFSRKSLKDQLVFDGFSDTQAAYGVAHSGL